jgi:hypothetical protein
LTMIRSSSRKTILSLALAAGWLTGIPALAQAQGISVQPAAKAPAANTEILKLRQQLAALEARIEELEKPDVEPGVDPDETARQEAHDKAFERRLAALEKSAADSGSKKDRPQPDDGDGEESITVRAPFVVHDKDGHTIFRIDTIGDGRPIAVVGNALGASTVIGIDPLGHSSIRLFSASRSAGVILGSRDDGGELKLWNNARKDAVTLSVDKSGAGRVKVHNSTGQAVTGLTSDASGGRVLVVDGKSGRNAVTLSTSAEGGLVNVYAPDGGSPRASMVADGKSGSLNVFNNNGVAAGVIEAGKAGSGRLVLANAVGDIVVEAGVLPKGIGIVRAGPGGDGPAAVVGGTVRPASSIQGRK